MARSLVRAGHQVTAAAAISAQSRRRVGEHFPGAVLTDPAGVLDAADLVLLTVPDDVLPGLVDGLAATGAPYAGRLVAHASGAHGIRVLDKATRAG
ncbi:MAG: oxidoreductase, partial [Trebonia sp.]